MVESFKQWINERAENESEIGRFRNLLETYVAAKNAGVLTPRLYNMVAGNYNDFQFSSLPNLFVVRPNICTHPSFEDYVMEDGGRGYYNYNGGTWMSGVGLLSKQISQILSMPQESQRKSAILFEEFPICSYNELGYPTHHKFHCFYGEVPLIQQTMRSGEDVWLDKDWDYINSTNDNVKQEQINEPIKELVMKAVKDLSIAAKTPYIRVDLVMATKGPMFRRLVSVPGDIRSKQYAWFYTDESDKELTRCLNDAMERLNAAE